MASVAMALVSGALQALAQLKVTKGLGFGFGHRTSAIRMQVPALVRRVLSSNSTRDQDLRDTFNTSLTA